MTNNAGAIKDYNDPIKRQWRGWVWNRIADRVKATRDTTILYLLGPTPRENDVAEALKRGYAEYNLIGVDNYKPNVMQARKDHLLAIHGDLDCVVAAWPEDWKVDAIIGDFCGGAGAAVMGFVYAVQWSEAFRDCVLLINVLRGRDKVTQGLQKTISHDSKKLLAALKCGHDFKGDKLALIEHTPKMPKGEQYRKAARKRAKRTKSLTVNQKLKIMQTMVSSKRLMTINQTLFTSEIPEKLLKSTPTQLDVYQYHSGHQVYETLMHHVRRPTWPELEASGRVTQTLTCNHDNLVETDEHPMDRDSVINDYYWAKARKTLSEMTQGEMKKRAQAEWRKIKRVKKSLPAIRAHQTRRKPT